MNKFPDTQNHVSHSDSMIQEFKRIHSVIILLVCIISGSINTYSGSTKSSDASMDNSSTRFSKEKSPLGILNTPSINAFPLAVRGFQTQIVIDDEEEPVVGNAADMLIQDIRLICGEESKIQLIKLDYNASESNSDDTKNKKEEVDPARRSVKQTNNATELADLFNRAEKSPCIFAGTLGRSSIITKLIQEFNIDTTGLTRKWERFLILNLTDKKGLPVLFIVGSDARGTAYGLLELSRMAGISPWVWWADARPEKKESLYVSEGIFLSNVPSIQFRGIFLNDEDWGLQPWAAATQDTDIKDIGPKTYEKIFQLMLRLRANFIWPAMHDCTKAFYYYPENPEKAHEYGIITGASHCEPMMRNNVDEWKNNFVQEYGKEPGEWRYDTNKQEIYTYWEDRVKSASKYENVYTVGMRGIHDSGMPGPKDLKSKVNLLDKVIVDQRKIFGDYFKKTNEVPQIYCPYKEALTLYQNGLKLPDDITLVWCDDNHGYIRQLSTPEEQRRSGRSGVYYHLSYWGQPHDYLWLSTTSPALISYEMTKAFQFGADRLWIFNVGDIKPAEAEIEFSMELAWNIHSWTPKTASEYSAIWAKRIFGNELGDQIGKIKNEYYLLNQNARPEHLKMVSFTESESLSRLESFSKLIKIVNALDQAIPAHLKSTWFELIKYPVLGAAYQNIKILNEKLSIIKASKGSLEAIKLSQSAMSAYDSIQSLTIQYNSLEAGKWKGMMRADPRSLPCFGEPVPVQKEWVEDPSQIKYPESGKYVSNISGSDNQNNMLLKYDLLHDNTGEDLEVFDGVGIGGKSIFRYPFTGKSFNKEEYESAPYIIYKLKLKAGENILDLKFLPTHTIHTGRNLQAAITMDNNAPQFIDMEAAEHTESWRENVLRGYSIQRVKLQKATAGISTIKIFLLDTGLALSSVKLF